MLLQGTLEMLVLRTLLLEPMHGWGIAQRVEQISRGRVRRAARIPLPRAPADETPRMDHRHVAHQ